MRTLAQVGYEEAASARAKADAFVQSWRDGGFERALTANSDKPAFSSFGPFAAVGHMPFPGHRHMGEL